MTRYKKWLIGSLVISAVSIALVTGLTFNSETVEALRRIKLEYILAAAILHISSYFIWGLRTRALCKALRYRISVLKMTEIVISSTFLAGITPSSAGGELLRVHGLSRNKIPIGKATAIVVGERLLDAIFIFSCLPFALYILGDILSNYEFDAALLTANVLVFVLLVFFIYGIWKPEKVKYVTHRLTSKIAPFFGKKTDAAVSHLMEQIDREIDHFHDSIRVFFTEGKRGLFWGIACTFIFWTVEFSILVLILTGLSQTPSILTAFAAQVLLAVIMVIPATPGASGIAELGAASIFSIFVDSSILGITVLAWRTLTYHMNLLIGGLMSLKVIKDMDIIKKMIGDTAEPQHNT
ncbi:flippase-like domain-containing protein [Methanosarcina sp. WWM596]|uniref:lysylphosphatidylglycerol synthase transmembrane domain-containing protein n=1 Tax=Methanosarcina sp. WWM596 TaxID=1434103 RepID=UPI0006160F21|nr:flippase-like domain-containing protein [Methanosarcina sp. WWM596]AKB17844.1 integral membrane protein [Methanosarcina sp. WWM596]